MLLWWRLLHNTGNFDDSDLGDAWESAKKARNQFLTDEFPTHPNRGVFCDLQGIKSGDQGNFHPDQGIPLSPLFWGLLPCRQSDRPDRSRTVPRRRTGRRQMLEVAEADLEHGFVHPQACRKSLAERVDANDRAFRAPRWRRGSRRTRPSAPSSP